MKLTLTFLAFFVAFAAASLGDETFLRREFRLFEQNFGKKYATFGERENRFKVFKQNMAEIQEHNLKGKSWQQGITEFADLTREEFVSQRLNGYVNLKKGAIPMKKTAGEVDLTQLPESVDWRELGAITEVKNQGSCGSCWAFATVECIESYVFVNEGKLPILSAQHITSCTPNEMSCGGTGGCAGSVPQLGFTYAQLFGVMTEEDWPYTSGSTAQTGDCDFNGSEQDAESTVRGFELIPRNDYALVMDHLANKGPLSIAVDASPWSLYFGGVFSGCNFDENINLNHAVQLVGYGTDESEGDYWIVRNSWGSGWGEDGYIRLQRQSTPQCGIDSTPLSGTACVNDGNDEQYVCGQCGILFDVTYPIGAMTMEH